MSEFLTGIDVCVASDAAEAAALVIARHWGIAPGFVAPWENSARVLEALDGASVGWVGWHAGGTGRFPSLVSVNWLPAREPTSTGRRFADLLPVLRAIRDELGVDIAVPDETHPSPLVLVAFRAGGVTEEVMIDSEEGGDIAAASPPPASPEGGARGMA